MFKSKNTFLLPFLFLTFMSAGILIGRVINTNSPAAGPTGNFSKMQEIIGILDQEYVDPIKRDELFEKTISDMLHKLDPHSNYIRAEDLKAVNEQMQGKFGGVGIRFAVIRDTLCVTNVVPGSPSERAGVKAGDRILKIDDKPVAGKKITTEKIMGMLKGEEGTPVTVGLLRGKKQLSTKIVRGIIPIESIVCATMLDKEVGYIRLDQFSVTSSEEFHNAAQYLLGQGMKKLIFDLRENGGGVLEGAVRISDEFLKENMTIVEVRGKNRSTPYRTTSSPGLLEQTPVVLLINENSASASEIVAGALQDNDRATLVGRRSFGKGLVQQDFQLRDGSDLRLTIARYYAPSGRCIQKDFDGDYDNYYHDQVNREENGEYFAPDSSVFKNAKKFKTTIKHRTVYGNSGITPDIFVPIDTSNSTYYYVDLRYSPAFQQFAFDYVQDKRTKWKNETDFAANFDVTSQLMEQFVSYAEKNHKVIRNQKEYKKSYELIRRALKAEIARQLFLEQGYFTVITKYDNEVQRALKFLKTH
jgi:carboxyl-terminal processing protease